MGNNLVELRYYHMKKALFFIVLFLVLCINSKGQNRRLIVEGLNVNKLDYNTIVEDSISALNEAKTILAQLYALSYLSATVDSFRFETSKVFLYINQGESYQWINLSRGNIEEEEASEIDLSGRLFLNRPFNAVQLQKLYQRTISYYENRGYPFASVKLDSVQLNSQNQLSAALYLKRNKFYKIDSILIKGKSGISDTYLLQYLGLSPGMPYDESKIKAISTRIQEIPFVNQDRRHEVQFFEEGVKIILHLKKKKASRFDGVIGLLTSEDDGKIELTGDVDLNLVNSFNRGEAIGFNWRKLKGNSQDLNIDFLYPYLFKTQFGVDFDFKLFKRDTTFLDLTTRLGINYLLARGEYFTFFLENKSSNLLSKNSFLNQSTSSLPALGDVNINSFGVSYQINRFNYKYNPTRGLFVHSQFSVGVKKLKKLIALEEENPSIYDGIDLKTNQYNGSLDIDYFIPLAKRSTIKLANKSGSTYSENLYQNELLRIGGLKILRGFDEESINASTYSIFTLEYRFLLDRNSYFSLFGDGGFYENNNVESYLSDTPFGVGAGVSFETNSGIFTFNYAVGKQFDNPIEFRAAKVHFGFINFF